jgi:hypothetical protein
MGEPLIGLATIEMLDKQSKVNDESEVKVDDKTHEWKLNFKDATSRKVELTLDGQDLIKIVAITKLTFVAEVGMVNKLILEVIPQKIDITGMGELYKKVASLK